MPYKSVKYDTAEAAGTALRDATRDILQHTRDVRDFGGKSYAKSGHYPSYATVPHVGGPRRVGCHYGNLPNGGCAPPPGGPSRIRYGYGGAPRRYGQPIVIGGPPEYGSSALALDESIPDSYLLRACAFYQQGMPADVYHYGGETLASPLAGLTRLERQMVAHACEAIDMRRRRGAQGVPLPRSYDGR